jgi:hypothetical protein
MRAFPLAVLILLGTAAPAQAQVNVQLGIQVPGLQIGIDLPVYPDLQQVPGYPVYYAPQASGNYFFYDGMYWVFHQDGWYSSGWYNGPWRQVVPYDVPSFVLRVPVRYYRQPPVYFGGWRPDAAPRWGEHWGRDWEQRRPGWDRWDRRHVPAPAPLPNYQRKYPLSRYPQEVQQQQAIRTENDHEPRPMPAAPRQQRPPPPQQHPQAGPPDRNPPRGAPSNRGQQKKDDKDRNGPGGPGQRNN